MAAPAVVAPPPGNPRFPHMDGLRAIAALSVVAFHSIVFTSWFNGWEGAYTRQLAAGVTVFFLLSGFLLYRPFVRARLDGTNAVGLGDYARRRLLRIVPAYWLALTVLALWPGLPGSPLGPHWWRFYLFLQDFRRTTLFDGLGTAWSLGTEMSFYLLLPLYAIAIERLVRRRALRVGVAVDALALLVLSLLSLAARATLSASHPHLGYTLLGTFDWFAAGMVVALTSAVVAHTGATPRLVRAVADRPTLCWVGALGALTAGAEYWRLTGRYDPYSGGPLHLIWLAAALFLLLPAAFSSPRGLPRRVLGHPLVAWLGIVSYGIYLWHLPLIPQLAHLLGNPRGAAGTLLLGVAAAACAVACAAASYYLVEKPLLRFKDGFGRRQEPVPAAATALSGGPGTS
jgi:peptidoglycan/LPS O-acetylase OafA/YrhL